MSTPRQRRLQAAALGLAFAMSAFTASPAEAAPKKDEKIVDARFTGYGQRTGNNIQPKEVALEPGTTATMYMLTGAIGVLMFGVLFKNAKRTHLD